MILCKPMSYSQSTSSINNGTIFVDCYFDDYVLYPSSFMTITPKYYTKHYFMGSERIGTTIGGGNNGNWLVNPLDNLTQDEYNRMMVLKDSYLYQHYYYDCYDYPHSNSNTENTNHKGTVEYGDADYQDYQYWANEQYYGNIWLLFKCPLAEDLYVYYQKEDDDEPFYYHSDHLGSAAWVTDGDGLPVQYIMYAPYGEELLNQHPWGYDERFTFTGKERDEETGYDYFGARYYLPIISIFGSVDPLANKYIYNSPYIYCDGNPIKFVDSDGRFFDDANEVTAQKIETECQNKLSSKMLNHFRRKELNKTLKDIADMRNDEKNEYRFELNKDKPGTTGKEEGGRQVITMYSNLERMDGTVAHEVRHGGQVARGEMFWDNMGNPQKYGVRKEVDAYRAQWGWDGYLTVLSDILEFPKEYTAQSYFDIDKDFVNSIMEKLDYLYPPKNPEGELLIDKKTLKKF